jgi:hypothetical protein
VDDVLDNEPARWLRPSRPVAIALVLVVVLAAVTWVKVGRRSHSAATAGIRLLVASTTSAAGVETLTLGTDAPSAVPGFPTGGCPVSNGFRIAGTDKWAVIWQGADSASPPCGLAAGSLYIVDAVASTARLIGSADRVVSADRGSVWTVAGAALLPGEQLTVPQRVQRVSLTGRVLSPVYRVPVGWTAISGLAPDLLLIARDLPAGVANWESWQPSTGAVVRQYASVLAAGPSIVAWVPFTCVPDGCPVHLSAPTGTADRTVSLPPGEYAYGGSVSDDGKYLALTVGTGVNADGSTEQDSGLLVDLSSGAVRPIARTAVTASLSGNVGLNWASRGWLIVSTPGAASGTSRLAAYNPTQDAFVVSPHVPAADESLVF